MVESLKVIGFTSVDGFMVFLCAFFAVISGIADYILKRADLKSYKVVPENYMRFSKYFPLLSGRLFISFLAGLIIWLLFFGIIPYTKEGVVRYIIFSLAAGYIAPSTASRYQDLLGGLIIK